MNKYKSLLILVFIGIISIPMTDKILIPNNLQQILIKPSSTNEIIFGTINGPIDADTQYMWDSGSYDFAYQIWEGLYAYNLSDPEFSLIPRLATDFGTWSGNNYTVTLRQGIYFHSGTYFNATAVKFTFDRLLYLSNFTGALTMGTIYGESIIKVLYMWPDGTPVLNRTEIVDEYTIKFILNRPYGVWLPLLTFTSSMILDPEITPADDYIADGMTGVTTSDISGTGPWIFDHHSPGIEVGFLRNDAYWRGPGSVETLLFSIITDIDTRNTALLNGIVDIIDTPHSSYYDIMEANPDVMLYNAGPGTIIHCLGINNRLYNVNWRNAISYAIDYDYLINNLLEGMALRLKSPIPNGILFANDSFDVPTYNLTKAREYMVNMGYGSMIWTDTQWQAANFLTVNYTYNLNNQIRTDFYTLLEYNLDNIGITVNDNGLEWDSYLDYLYGQEGFNHLSLFWIGWMPDFNDPSNYVNNLMSNISFANLAQINDPYLEALMLSGVEETNQNTRKLIYEELQRFVVEDLRPWAFAYVTKNYDAWTSGPDYELKGYPSNGLGYNYFYPCYYENLTIPDYSIQINHPSDVSYLEGSLGNTITWYLTAQDVLNPTYAIYRDISFIENDTWTSGSPIVISVDGLPVGSYVYSIMAQNSIKTAFDTVLVTVSTEGNGVTTEEISGFPFALLIISSMISLIYIRRKMKKQTRHTRRV